METSAPVIREIRPEDNVEVAAIVRKVLVDLRAPKVGTAYADTTLEHMYENYDVERSIYFVVAQGDKIMGCGGIAPLDNHVGNVCELQKMYFLEEARGRGLGKEMIERCLQSAREFNFEGCYLETMPYMKAAQELYKKMGFEYIDAPMGDTGHYSCPVWMFKKF
ncbi:GNAT family N-acetyltransferase [Kriegella aquimaris]|uniref:Putative acetyltransferase n=1 Tax=Kriegella aquimaris TaxID=192904 RepID=A0A1G9K6K8_9FLAO|nr:GNAT family N-acetyltransferase [Kriegella aquimaris]SDL45388.1 putative acetyltransferase [Kriegella aquimaris]